jgi:hypothetical protein
MTAKDKSNHLYLKYLNLLISNYDLDGEDYLTKVHAKQCAIIAVDEIIGVLDSLVGPEYVAFLLKDQVSIETEYETHLNGYELKQFYEDVRATLETF